MRQSPARPAQACCRLRIDSPGDSGAARGVPETGTVSTWAMASGCLLGPGVIEAAACCSDRGATFRGAQGWPPCCASACMAVSRPRIGRTLAGPFPQGTGPSCLRLAQRSAVIELLCAAEPTCGSGTTIAPEHPARLLVEGVCCWGCWPKPSKPIASPSGTTSSLQPPPRVQGRPLPSPDTPLSAPSP